MSSVEDENPRTWQQVRSILDRALAVAAPERLAFIEEECSDAEIRKQAISVLQAYESATDPKPLPAARKIIAALPAHFSPGAQVGPYVLEKALGAGGMGAVFLARRADRAFEKQVAIKLIKRQWASEREIGRFRSERQILANLTHPSIAQLLDGGETEAGQPYLVMEYVQGRSITAYCRDEALTLDQRLDLFMQVCSAVQFAHQNLIVHRDLKPGNILVSHKGKVKLLDFGIAKILDVENFALTVLETQPGGSPMTLAYASPEQVQGQNITTATDVYALGILLYELLTGRRPHEFDGRNLPAAMQAICSQEATAPSEQLRSSEESHSSSSESPEPESRPELLVPWKRIQGDLDAIVLKALAKEPQHRYASAEQLSEDLHRFRMNEPVRARRDTFFYRSRKFLIRNRLPLGAVGAVLFVLLISIFLLVQNRQELIRQKTQAETVSNWMTELFEFPRSFKALGRTVTARELLDKSVESIHTELAHEPEVLARMLLTLAESYINLGLNSEGKKLSDSGLEVANRLGRNDYISQFLYFSAICNIHLGDFEQSIEQIDLALDHYLSPHEKKFLRDKASFLMFRGRAELNLTRLKKAQQTYKIAESLARESGDQEVLADVLEYFGDFYVAKDSTKAAEAKFRESFAIRKDILQVDHPLRTSVEWKLLWGLASSHNAYASRQADRLLARAIKVQGEQKFALALHYHEWARVKQRAHVYEESRTGYREAIRLSEEKLGPQNTFVFPFINNYADMELNRGNIEVAEAIYHDLLARTRQVDSRSLMAGAATHQLGVLSMNLGKFDEAETLLKESLKIFENKLGSNHEKTVTALNNLGMVERNRKNHEAATRWFKEAVERGRRAPEPPSIMTLTLRNLAESYSASEDFEASGRIHAEIVEDEGLKTTAGLESLTWQAACYLELEQWQKGLDLATLAYEEWEIWEHEKKSWRVVSMRLRGHALIELGRPQEALDILQEVLDYRLRMGASEVRFAKIRGLIAQAEEAIAEAEATPKTTDDTVKTVPSGEALN